MSYDEISADELAERLDSGASATLIDVRQPDEYAEVHVPGARLMPLGEVPDHVDELRCLGPLVLICRSGGRSAQACGFLAAAGLEVTNVAGGTMAWVESGRPTRAGDQPG